MTSVALRTDKGRLGVRAKAFLTPVTKSFSNSPAAVSKDVGVVYIAVGFAHA